MMPIVQVSKFTCTNTVTSSRTLVKSHEVFQKVRQSYFRKKLIWKISQKIRSKETSSPFFSYILTCKKQPHHSYFPMTFEKIFRNTVFCQNTGKATEGFEVFIRICFSKKLISIISQNSSKRNYDKVLF